MDIRQSRTSPREFYEGRHRFEHWYRDNQVYFITAKCRDAFHAFATESAKTIFWKSFDRYTDEFGFVPWVTSLLNNHYHTLGYLKFGKDLPKLMQRLHGSVAKLVNDELTVRLIPFWIDSGKKNYFDGCIRDALQAMRAYRYTLMQCRRHGVCDDPRKYPHTRVNIEMERAIRLAAELNAFLEGVPYARYAKWKSRRAHRNRK